MHFTLVIPVLNEEKLISRCLDSLKELDYPNDQYEVLIVDNGSTDRTVEIARSYGYRVVIEPERGIIQARQRGLDEAKGTYYITTDADALVPKDWLKVAYGEFSKENVIGLTGPTKINDRGPTFSKFIYIITWLMARYFGKGALLGCNMAFKVDIAREVGRFRLKDYKYYEDSIISIRLAGKGKISQTKDFYTIISFRRYEGLKVFRIFRNLVNYFSLKYFGVLTTDRFNFTIQTDKD